MFNLISPIYVSKRGSHMVLRIVQRMNAKHPFLDGAYLWFSPRNFFFADTLPNVKLSLKWDRLPGIRRVAPSNRAIDPDSRTPPKKVHPNPVYLPSMKLIVRTLCPNMVHLSVSQPKPASPTPTPVPTPIPVPTPTPVDDGGEDHGNNAVASSSRVRIEDLRAPSVEEIIIGDDVEFDWEWWGSCGS